MLCLVDCPTQLAIFLLMFHNKYKKEHSRAICYVMLESCLAYHLEYEGKTRVDKLIIKDHLTNCPPDDPAPVPDHPGGQLEGLELPLPSLSLHLWGRTLLLPPQCRQVSQLVLVRRYDSMSFTRNKVLSVNGQ